MSSGELGKTGRGALGNSSLKEKDNVGNKLCGGKFVTERNREWWCQEGQIYTINMSAGISVADSSFCLDVSRSNLTHDTAPLTMGT